MSFYGQNTNINNYPEWMHKLETVKCRDFFGLDYDASLLKNLVVPVEGFELLLDVIDLVGYNKETIKLIKKNMLKDYDLKNLPEELANEISKKLYNIVSGHDDGSIKIWNADSGELINTLNGHYRVDNVCYNPDKKQIISGSGDRSIKIWDAENGNLICTLNGHNYCVWSVCYNPDKKQIISGTYNSIGIWNAENGDLVRTLNSQAWNFCYNPDLKQIISGEFKIPKES